MKFFVAICCILLQVEAYAECSNDYIRVSERGYVKYKDLGYWKHAENFLRGSGDKLVTYMDCKWDKKQLIWSPKIENRRTEKYKPHSMDD